MISDIVVKKIVSIIENKKPLIIGITGSVSVGKSFFAKELKDGIESYYRHNIKIIGVSTDGFLFPKKNLVDNNILDKKGFPESYDLCKMNTFLQNVKEHKQALAPIYSHEKYDIIPDENIDATDTDVLMVEGLCVLHENIRHNIDLSIYIHAEEDLLLQWYIERSFKNREKAKNDAKSYFVKYLHLSDDEFRTTFTNLWNTVNRPNLYENILPYKQIADIVVQKDVKHNIKIIKN